tara:strand:- start:7186 stop:11631 length:4446 start_codon:yes stop_codon:yes gene_type:complete
MEKGKKTTWQKWKIPAIIAGIILVLLFAVRLTVQSDWFFNKARTLIISQAEQNINGTLDMESMRGDLFSGFVIQGLSIKDEESTLLEVDSVVVQYRFWSALKSPHEIDKIELKGAHLTVREEADSTWNIMNLINVDRDDDTSLYWKVNDLLISDFSTDIQSENYLPEGFLRIENFGTNVSAGFVEEGFFGTIRQLEFQLYDGKLPEGIGIELTASAGDGIITLESLLLDSGRSLLSASAELGDEDELDADLEAATLSWRDILLYAEEVPLQQDLSIEIGASGNLDNLNLSLNANSTGLGLMQMAVGVNFEEVFSIHTFDLELNDLNLSLLTGIENSPTIEHFSAIGSGQMIPSRHEEATWTGDLTIEGAEYDSYQFDQLSIDYSLSNGELHTEGFIDYRDQRIDYLFTATELFGQLPNWAGELSSSNLDAGIWLGDNLYSSDLNLRVDAKGSGFKRDQINSSAEVAINGDRTGDQLFSAIDFNGELNSDRITGLLRINLDRSEFVANVDVTSWIENPEYRFSMEINEFNAAEINGYELFPTYINGLIDGEGSGIEPNNIQLTATAALDSSIVNGEAIEILYADFRVSNQFLYVDNALLESPMLDASFSMQQHLTETLNRNNRLQFEAFLKDLIPLGPLFGVERLESEGRLSGQLNRNDEGILEFTSELDLERMVVDTLFSSEEITGRVNALIKDQSEIDLVLDLKAPMIYSTGVQDLQISAKAILENEYTTGELSFILSNENQSSYSHSGEFSFKPEDYTLLTNEVIFDSGIRTLTLDRPFELTFKENVLRSDTLTISTSTDDSWLSLWIPHLDSLQQDFGIEANYLNLGNLQQTFIEETFLGGYLSGSMDFKNNYEGLSIRTSGRLSEFSFEEGKMDSLQFDMEIEDEWLNAYLNGWHQDSKIADASLRIPYLPGDPRTFDNQFFERAVEGHFEVSESDLSYWLTFLPNGGPDGTDGRISLNTTLSGIAGSPELMGQLSIENGLFSGIPVDQVTVDLSYIHDESTADISGLIVKDQQDVLEFDTQLPFLVDLKRAELILPSDDDDVFANLQTNDFDLATLNNYLDQDQIRNIRGRLNGNMTISGKLSDLRTDGEMRLTGGAMRYVPTAINITEIRSTVQFEPQRMVLQEFNMRSGPGTIRASGSLNLENLNPEAINVELRANQFRVANTQDTNAMINGQARVSGTIKEPSLNGSITFLNGFIFLENFGERSVESVTLEDETEKDPFDIFESLEMEMSISFGRQFFLRNRQYLDMEIELGGQVDLLKDRNAEMQIFGSLEGLNGYARPLGKNFDLDSAEITFFGPPENPQLNIVTKHEPPQAVGVTIFYIIEGTLEEPEFRFDSQPELELQDMVSYTLFGKPFYELESWEQVVAGSGSSPTAADYALEVLLDRVEMLASQRLGIDVVQIDNTRAGSSNTTSIKTGWHLNPRTFFAILNEVGGSRPKTLFLLEYLLTENLELIILQGDDLREGIDLRWNLDY